MWRRRKRRCSCLLHGRSFALSTNYTHRHHIPVSCALNGDDGRKQVVIPRCALMKGDRLDCQQHSRWTNIIVSSLFLSRERGRRWTREKPSAWTEPSKGLLSNGSRCKRSPSTPLRSSRPSSARTGGAPGAASSLKELDNDLDQKPPAMDRPPDNTLRRPGIPVGRRNLAKQQGRSTSRALALPLCLSLPCVPQWSAFTCLPMLH
jgi:hypothetical protein